jgi:hypothetical protein
VTGFGGIFSGLWSGVSNTISQGMGFTQHVYDEKNGIADKDRAAAQNLAIINAQTREKQLIIIGVVIMVVVITFKRK